MQEWNFRTALVQHFITKGYLVVQILVVSVCVCVLHAFGLEVM